MRIPLCIPSRLRFRNLILTSLLVSLTLLTGTVAAAETYSLKASTRRIVEGEHVSLNLTVEGTNPAFYEFQFEVTDSNSQTYTSRVSHNAGLGETAFELAVDYPNDFAGGHTDYVGNYTVDVFQRSPIALATPVAQTSFLVGILNRNLYQRTETVFIRTTGNAPSSVLYVTFTGPTSFAWSEFADVNGVMQTSWRIPVNATTSMYDVAIFSDPPPFKPVLDAESFGVTAAQLSAGALVFEDTSLQRTQTASVTFSAIYPDGSPVQTGSALLLVLRPDSTNFTLTASPDIQSGNFKAIYQTAATDVPGQWIVRLRVDTLVDTYGNGGTSTIRQGTFNVEPAQLTLSVIIDPQTITLSEFFIIQATANYPSGSLAIASTVKANISFQGQAIATNIPMTFDGNLNKWVASYQTKSSDSPGVWTVTVKAEDSSTPSNAGISTAVVFANAKSDAFAQWPLFMLGGVGASAIGTTLFFLKRRRTLVRKVLKVDLQAIESEADKIRERQLFQSIRNQLDATKKKEQKDA